MNKLYKKYQKALSDKVAAAKGNALSMAAPLSTDDDDTSASKAAASAAAAAPVVKEPPNQRLGMLRAFLALGNLKHALFILARYPWLCGAYPDVASLYCRILNHVLAPTHDAISFATLTPALSSDSTASACSHFDTKKQLLVPTALPKLVLTAIAPEPARSLTIQHVFFFQGWKRDLPRCGASEDVLRTFAPLLRFLGVHLHRDVQLLQRLCRIGKVHLKVRPHPYLVPQYLVTDHGRFYLTLPLQTSSDEQVQKGWLDIVRLHLLPALSLTSCNSGLVAELWLLLRTMPYETRFALYGEWKYVLYKQHPELRVRKEETEKEAKGILKRISKENLKPSGRNLAKASHANPTIFFTVALNQVQAYDNLVVPIVESAKYLTHFEYDVFSFIVIDALSNPEKERTKQDGTNISLWLKSASALGTLCARAFVAHNLTLLCAVLLCPCNRSCRFHWNYLQALSNDGYHAGSTIRR